MNFISNSASIKIIYRLPCLYVSKYFEEQASDPSTTPVNAYIQKTVDATSISERSIRRIGKEQYDTVVLLPHLINVDNVHVFFNGTRGFCSGIDKANLRCHIVR
jgi:hypothetical protein